MPKYTKKKIKEQVKAIMESKSMEEAYMKTHNCTPETAKKNAYKVLKNPEMAIELEKQLETIKPLGVNKENMVKLLSAVVIKWQNGEERTSDFLRALELMSKLVPEFIDRHAIDDYGKMSDEELDKAIKEKYKRFNTTQTPSEN